MIERFQGTEGTRHLADALADQIIVNGDTKIANAFLGVVQLNEFASGDVLVNQGDEDTDMLFVLSGKVGIEVNGRQLAVRGPGTHVGEMGLIDCKSQRSATVRAVEKTVVAGVPEPSFAQVANANPTMWRRIAVELCDRLRQRSQFVRQTNETPRVFICSSAEYVDYAEAIRLGLDYEHCVVVIWTDQVFQPTKHTMEDLERELDAADFAVALVMDEDIVEERGERLIAPRDNVVFELGLFIGQLGRARSVIVTPRGVKTKLPSDLDGLTPLTFVPPTDRGDSQQLTAAVGPICTQLKSHFRDLGPR